MLGAIGGFMAMTSTAPEIGEKVLSAAGFTSDEVNEALKDKGCNERFNCTMWNICNDSIGVKMESHTEILAKMKEPK